MPHAAPELTLTARAFVRMVGVTVRLSKRRAWALSVAWVAATIALEHFSGAILSVSFLYMFTAAAAVWCLGERDGLLLAILGVIGGAVVKHVDFMALPTRPDIGLATEAWNAFARILSVTLVGIVANGFRTALALERWRASSDGLTGALNKAAFHDRAAIAVQRARAQGHALVLAYMDLDGFKAVNDRHGHSAGDRVLHAFAAAANAAIRDADLFARIGGDEFAALMVVRSCEDGDQVAEMLHGRLSRILRETGFPVTCSMGALVTCSQSFDLDGGSLELADTLMYEVKRSGKNALRIARGGKLGTTLHAAYPPPEDEVLGEILKRIDRADAAQGARLERRVAV